MCRDIGDIGDIVPDIGDIGDIVPDIVMNGPHLRCLRGIKVSSIFSLSHVIYRRQVM
jgi:hypothetical protein